MASAEVFAPKPVTKVTSATSSAIQPPTPPLSPKLPTPRTIAELISLRARELPNEPILGYPSDNLDYVEYTFQQLETFAARAAFQYSEHLPIRKSSKEAARVVALLGPSDLNYVVTTLALTRLGFTVLFLSTRISEAAYLSLLEATECDHIIVHQSFQKPATALTSKRPDFQVLSILQTNVLESSQQEHEFASDLDLAEETNKICWIIHSSGSTGLPKPIYQTHSAALRNYENNMNMEGFITLPLFHAHGLSSVFRAITSIKKIYMQSASLPLTRQNLLQILHKNSFEIFYGVPYALKLLSETPEGVSALAAMKVVMFGGSACPDALGDLLVEGGVNLISHYGTTETGQLMTSFRPKGDKAWNYVRVHEKLAPFVRFEDRGGNLHELVILEGWPSKVATNRADGSYATKDLFEPHASIDGAWKYSGRLDDTIVLVNGEKAIPIAMEQALRQDKHVCEAVVFGTGKSLLGMIVIASELAVSMPASEVIDAIWPTVAAENATMPGYAQLVREMVRVLPAGTAYPSTDKGTMIRQAFYRTFQSVIDEIYQNAEAKSEGTLFLSESELREFLRSQLLEIAPQENEIELGEDTDLFSLGIDSLQSTRLRTHIMKEIQLNGKTLPQNVVFEHPTIAKLAQAIINIRDSKATDAKDLIREMQDLVTKYGTFPQHVPVKGTSDHSCVIVTGATGSLGAHIVARLATRHDVSEVVCLVRSKDQTSARQRVIASLRERQVYHNLSLAARRKICCYPSDFSQSKLGLSDFLYENLTAKVSSLIHCAWSVNFNKSLSSFEGDCIAGARNLMLLCLSAKRSKPASFNFCSSVSTVAATPGDLVSEEVPDFSCAQGMGYAQSKLVTEHIIQRAAVQTGMQARALRVGQIIADTQHGIWNDTEAIPLMLRAATTIGALPELDENPRWMPVDVVASTVMEISLSSTEQITFNIVNPHTFHWTRDLLPALRASGLDFTPVSQREWIKRLRASNPDPEENPTIKLVEFFASKYDNDVTTRKTLQYTTTASETISPALRKIPALDSTLVTKFIQRFLSTTWSWGQAKVSTARSPTARVVVIAGPCGTGKTTIATELGVHLSCPIIEGDNIHDAVAVTKMGAGIPLSPVDRQIWLARIKIEILERLRAREFIGESFNRDRCEFILTCSALNRNYRDTLRDILGDKSVDTVFVFLQAGEEELVRRVGARKGHYMKENMVRSQIEAVQEPLVDETDVLPVDAEKDSATILSDILAGLKAQAWP